jgi:hypothetical protein
LNRFREHKLNEALDEVITLFTPARWAYEGLFVSTQVSDGKVGVDLLTAKTRSLAEIRLNPAALNLVILGLHLMCGPTVDNPLGTLTLNGESYRPGSHARPAPVAVIDAPGALL